MTPPNPDKDEVSLAIGDGGVFNVIFEPMQLSRSLNSKSYLDFLFISNKMAGQCKVFMSVWEVYPE